MQATLKRNTLPQNHTDSPEQRGCHDQERRDRQESQKRIRHFHGGTKFQKASVWLRYWIPASAGMTGGRMTGGKTSALSGSGWKDRFAADASTDARRFTARPCGIRGPAELRGTPASGSEFPPQPVPRLCRRSESIPIAVRRLQPEPGREGRAPELRR